jgi:hypothetical protein
MVQLHDLKLVNAEQRARLTQNQREKAKLEAKIQNQKAALDLF